MEKARLSGVRFAPSPTGRFHVGNLRTAWISHRWARALDEPWVVRFEDIDGPRVLAGAQESQLEDMKALGLVPDELLVQSSFHARHWEAFARAASEDRVYPCYCSRKDVREALEGSASAPHAAQAVYSGRCRALEGRRETGHGLPSLGWRFALDTDPSGRGDIIVARSGVELDARGLPDPATFVPAYHWACAIDDWDGGYSLLVRASDLLEVAAQHRAIMRWWGDAAGVGMGAGAGAGLGRGFPAVFHTALVTGNGGERLEKRTRGVTLPELRSAGWTEASLMGRFAASFSMRVGDFEPGQIFGETRSAMTLAELGI